MDIRHLRLFLKTLEHGNITSAAAELGISQPALSKQLSRLEEEFEVELLERLPRGVRPSAMGKILHDYAKSIDASYRSALRHLESARNDDDEETTIGSGYYWLNGLLPRAVAQLVQDRPGARIRIVAGVPELLTEQLLRGEIDLVFGPVAFREEHHNLIEAKSLVRTDTQILVRKGHPASDGIERSIEDLTHLDWALPRGTFIRKRFDQLFQTFGVAPPVPKVEVNDVSFTLEVVANTDLATLATSVTPLGETWQGFDRIRCANVSGYRETGILRRKHDVMPNLCRELCERLEALCADHVHTVPAWSSV